MALSLKNFFSLYSASTVYTCLAFPTLCIIEIDTLEYQQTEKIETELKDVESVRLLSRVAFWGVIRALLLVLNICYPNHLSAPH